ncbi:MAG TPA: MFS transporter [Candidatus Solibacter sp.]|jgi:MFS family permease|nr:MFS transporter [Candidatus Solibacter sp.]
MLGLVRRIAVDVSPLRESRDYRRVWSGQLISLIGRQVTVVAVPFQVYSLTHSSVAVGAIGIFQVVPYVLLSLVGGSIADRVDRRKLLLLTQVLLAAASTVLMLAAFFNFASLALLYVMVGVVAAISAVNLPAQSAMTPNLVKREHLPSALALNFAEFQTSLIAGPAVAGLVLARVGLGAAYAIDVVTFAASLLALFLIPAQPPKDRHEETPLQSIVQGFRFVGRQKAVLGGFAVDLNAMIFGMPRALFPVLAIATYHAGPTGLGLLYAAPGVGAVVGSVLSGFVAHIRRQGRAVIVGAAGWGLAILLFGLFTNSLWLGLVLLAIAGAFDTVSAIARSTVLQTVTPDRLRGRANAANSMVVVGGPMVGDLRAGAMGGLISPEFSLVFGGAVVLAACAIIARVFPALTDYDSKAPPGLETGPATLARPV